MTHEVLVLIVFLFLSAFFSSAETAFFSLSKLRVKYLVKRGVRGAKLVDRLKVRQQRLLITILLGNNIVNVAAAAIATSLALELTASHGVSIATGTMTLVILVFGEIMPKSLATRYNRRLALIYAPVIIILQYLLFPVVWIFEMLMNRLPGTLQPRTRPLITEDELQFFVSMAASTGQIESDESVIIDNVFKLNDLCAKDVMIPWEKVKRLNPLATNSEALLAFRKASHSRLPLEEQPVKRYVHYPDVERTGGSIQRVARPLLTVNPGIRVDELLQRLRKSRQRMVLVGEKGNPLGIVTTKDILEELVGSLADET